MSPNKRITLASIAEYTGVSVGSVSSVLNNRQLERRIPLRTAQKIREAAARLGYLPNISARRLRGSEGVKNNILLAMVTSFEAPIPLLNHFLAALHEKTEDEEMSGKDQAFSVVIEMFSAGKLRHMPGLLTGDRFNAAILSNTIAEDDEFLMRSHLPYPTVLINRSIPGYSSVIENPCSGARAAEVLVAQGLYRLAVLHGSPLTQSTKSRVDAFMRRTMELTGRPAREIMAEALAEDAGYEAMGDLLRQGKSCDGLYAVSDALALGAYCAIRESGYKIPKDIAIIGVGDYDIAPHFDPPLSSVGVSHKHLAERASHLLLKQLYAGRPFPEVAVVPIQETLRASSGHGA